MFGFSTGICCSQHKTHTYSHRALLLQHAALKNASSSNEQEYRSYQEAVKRLKATVAQRRDIVK